MIETIHQEIDNLPKEAQEILLDFVHILKKRYLPTAIPDKPVNNYENFKKIGLIGCCSTDQNLSTNYKHILTEGWTKKYDHR
ncbi:DUF2281 domain-containing protein [Pseudanabaena sp. SR411]|uniref:DUF2281 domain-containing protein n=1 Tax=Pseudanabaena sp. SR411 TaxID=1980935 RepID=UPI000B97FF91|nr:DUF2281 domain-containing protein [Pseudanabaena sp. SR411]OYQ65580.1 DUF2281 domain-containing protein [Pseudanabaena sp. SR411]